MTPSFLDSVLRGAEALAARDLTGTMPDPDLLHRFVTERDQTAFAVLVRRHGPLVWGVCRNLLPADADAEDAFQATFLALVRSASSIHKTEAVGGWLHGVAYRVAMKARRAAARRKHRETRAAVPEPNAPVSDAAWDELQAAVHEEVCRLPDKLRVAFVLCGLQGRPQKDAAEQLGWKIGTLSGRLTQARQRLLDRLARRGVPVGMAAGATVLGATCGSAAVPSMLVERVLSTTSVSDSISPVVLSLSRGVTQVYMTRTKMLVAGLLVAGALTTGLGTRLLSSADAQSAPTQDAVDKGLKYLRDAGQAKNRWEYRFVPVDKPMSATDLQKFLSAADQEGWEYCGSQDLLPSEKAKAGTATMPHMVFKRPRTASVSRNEREAAALALAELADATEKERLAQHRAAELQYKAALQAAEAALNEKKAAEVTDRERAKTDELAKTTQQAKAEKEDLLRKIQELEARLNTREAVRNPSGLLSIPLKHVTASEAFEALKKAKLHPGVTTVDNDTNTIVVSVDVAAKVKELIASIDVAPGKPGVSKPEVKTTTPATVEIELKNIEGKVAAELIAKSMPAAKIIQEVRPKGILLSGPLGVLREARAIIEKADAKSGDPSPFATDKPDFVLISLKYASAVEVARVVKEVFDQSKTKVTCVAEPMSNKLLVAGPPDSIAAVKKIVTELDIARPAK